MNIYYYRSCVSLVERSEEVGEIAARHQHCLIHFSPRGVEEETLRCSTSVLPRLWLLSDQSSLLFQGEDDVLTILQVLDYYVKEYSNHGIHSTRKIFPSQHHRHKTDMYCSELVSPEKDELGGRSSASNILPLN